MLCGGTVCVWSSGCAGCVACALWGGAEIEEKNAEETAVYPLRTSVYKVSVLLSDFSQLNCLAVHRHVLRCVSSIYLAPGLPLEAAEGIEWAER